MESWKRHLAYRVDSRGLAARIMIFPRSDFQTMAGGLKSSGGPIETAFLEGTARIERRPTFLNLTSLMPAANIFKLAASHGKSTDTRDLVVGGIT